VKDVIFEATGGVNVTSSTIAIIVAASGFGATIVALINAFAQRRKVGADTSKTGADATAVVTAAARELVDPLRKELANERAAHSAEVDMERKKVAEVRTELQAMTEEAKALRKELGAVRRELDRAWEQIAIQKRTIRDLENGS
jgi:septal ring factor EnvC (AmiA/AmiB activator)